MDLPSLRSTVSIPYLGLDLDTPLIAIALAVSAFVALALLLPRVRGQNGLHHLPDTIPFVSNTYQYLTDQKSFLQRASKALQSSSISKLHLGPVPVYLIAGPSNMQAIFRTSPSISAEKFIILVSERLHGVTKKDLARYLNDRSGWLKTPASGTESLPEHKRVWAGSHHVFQEYLARTDATAKMAKTFYGLFSSELEKEPLGTWSTFSLSAYIRRVMAECALVAVGGRRILELNDGYIEKFWEFDAIAGSLLWGLPALLKPRPWRIRDEFHAMMQRLLDEEYDKFDWEGPAAQLDWEPIWGSRYTRELIKWTRDVDFETRSRAGVLSGSIYGLNSNTIPMATWALMEIVKDPDLYHTVREEVLGALETDPETGSRQFNIKRLLSLPLLQSIYTEVLRLHVSINVTREVTGSITLGGHSLPKGALIQAPTSVAHLNEAAWARPGHPASQFWPERHIKLAEKVDQQGAPSKAREFGMAGRPSDYFPYGGGLMICPGRHFAKQEIMLTIACIVSRFGIEFVGWVNEDGSPSARPPQDDPKFAGAAAMPPDRDARIRWKRLW